MSQRVLGDLVEAFAEFGDGEGERRDVCAGGALEEELIVVGGPEGRVGRFVVGERAAGHRGGVW